MDADGAAVHDTGMTITAQGEGTFRVCFTYPSTQSVTISVFPQSQKPDVAML